MMCGIAAISSALSSKSVLADIVRVLISLQHRGQESAGISYLGEDFQVSKGFGFVSEVFKDIDLVSTNVAIGHVRYSTTGVKKVFEEIQPMMFRVGSRKFALAFNGNIVNHYILRKEVIKNYKFRTNTDTETIGALLVKGYEEHKDFIEAYY